MVISEEKWQEVISSFKTNYLSCLEKIIDARELDAKLLIESINKEKEMNADLLQSFLSKYPRVYSKKEAIGNWNKNA